jgi:hypothetical protein
MSVAVYLGPIKNLRAIKNSSGAKNMCVTVHNRIVKYMRVGLHHGLSEYPRFVVYSLFPDIPALPYISA